MKNYSEEYQTSKTSQQLIEEYKANNKVQLFQLLLKGIFCVLTFVQRLKEILSIVKERTEKMSTSEVFFKFLSLEFSQFQQLFGKQ